MLFNSIEFIILFIITFCLYWFVLGKQYKLQNILLCIVSYIFYAWWDWRFLFLIIASSLWGFISGFLISASDSQHKKTVLAFTIILNVLFLFYFKYYNFFIESLTHLADQTGFHLDVVTKSIILPIGISFYTFHNISYIIDVYRGHIPPCKDPVVYFTFINYFPQLVAGPIQRAKDLIPQFQHQRSFSSNQATRGLELILWGAFKKIVIADNCSKLVNEIFLNYNTLSSAELILGVVYFAFQIYGDFSGYTDMALGISKLLGIELTTNFKTPYFSKSVGEFWRRWHISLSNWFRDYIYIPLGGNKEGKIKTIRNTAIIFIVSGFWHGANWTYVVWGGLNALFIITPLIIGTSKTKEQTNPVINFLKMFQTFFLICIAWIFFRAPSITEAWHYLTSIFTNTYFPKDFALFSITRLAPLLGLFLVIEWFIYKHEETDSYFTFVNNRNLKWAVYICLVFIVILNLQFHNQEEFIYFQF